MPRGEVTDDLVDFHLEVARGGAAMTTVAYCAVSPGGRVHRDTMVLDRRRAGDLRRLTDAVHAENTLVCAQIGHAGLIANTRSNRMATLAPSTRISAPAMGLVRAATVAQLGEVVDDFGTAARNAVEAGFDAIDLVIGGVAPDALAGLCNIDLSSIARPGIRSTAASSGRRSVAST